MSKKQSKFWTEDATLKDKVAFCVWAGYGISMIAKAGYDMYAAHVEHKATMADLDARLAQTKRETEALQEAIGDSLINTALRES